MNPQRAAKLRQRITQQLKTRAQRGARCERIVQRDGAMAYCGYRSLWELNGVPYCPTHFTKGLAQKQGR